MTVQDPSFANELEPLAGTRDGGTGATWPEQISSWYDELLKEHWHLFRSIAPLGFRIERDDGGAGSVRVLAGRATIRGHSIAHANGGALTGTTAGVADLSSHAGSTVYVALIYSIANARFELYAETSGTGWPGDPHIKLAEVVVDSGGAIAWDAITDRRGDQLLANLVEELAHYDLSINTQGDTASPTRVHVQLEDLAGGAIGEVDYLRVRVCDDGAYGDATNATIAAAGSTTVAETITAGTDLVFKGSAAGLFEIDLTDATAETVTVRIGPAPLSARRADYSQTLDVTHAAP